MTYHPGRGYPQQPTHANPPAATGPVQGPHWPVPQPPTPPGRRPGLLIAIGIAVLVAATVLTVVYTTSGSDGSWHTATPGNSNARTPTAASSVHDPTTTAASTGRPPPPPTPTGKPYDNDDPQIGDCADLARQPTGIIIYQADCNDPAATLILDSVHPENKKCPAKGYFGLNSLSNQQMCFTYNLTVGDCVDIQIPRRTACDDPASPAGGNPTVTVADIQLGQHDGTGCANPALFLQVGKDSQRGTACLVTNLPGKTTPEPSR